MFAPLTTFAPLCRRHRGCDGQNFPVGVVISLRSISSVAFRIPQFRNPNCCRTPLLRIRRRRPQPIHLPASRFLHHLKGKVGNKARVESSICNAYLMEEITNFVVTYFDDKVDTKATDLPQNLIRVDQAEADASLPSVFSQNIGYAPSEGTVRFLDHRDHRIAHAYVLSNCGLLKEYERFGDRRVVNVIAEAIQMYYREPFTRWTDAPPDHKAFWWNCFKTFVHASDTKDSMMRCSSNARRETEKTRWRARRGRFVTATETLHRRPSAAELFVATHSKVDESGHRVWCDSYAQDVYDKYEQMKVGCDVRVGSEADDHLFFKACGGYNNKGRIYGLGSEGPSIFEKPSRARSATAESSSYTSPVVTQLQAQLHSTQSELQTTQAELQTTKERLCSTEDELRTTREELESTRRQLRADPLELHARFDSFSSRFGHPTTHGGNSLDSA